MKKHGKPLHTLVGESLMKSVAGATQVDAGRWKFSLTNGAPAPGTARIEDGWLLLEVALNNAPRQSSWNLVARNAQLEGQSKFVLARAGRDTSLRSEIPFDFEDGPSALAARISESCAGFTRALRWLHGEDLADNGDPAFADGAAAPSQAPDPARMLEQAGWPFSRRDGEKFVIALEAGTGFFQAVLEATDGHRLVVHAEIGAWQSLAPVCREALGRLLLTTGAVVRMARPVVTGGEGSATARFEIRHSSPRPSEVAHALSALSIACGLCAREAHLFEDEKIARAYLRLTEGSVAS